MPYVTVTASTTLEQAIKNNTNELARGFSAIGRNLSAIEIAMSGAKQKEMIVPAKSSAFPFLAAGFFLLVSAAAASAYYYRTEIAQAFQSNTQTQANAPAALTTQSADAASQTDEQPIQPPASAAITAPAESIALQAATLAGLFSGSSTRSPSSVEVSSQNSPVNTPASAPTQQGGLLGILPKWFS